MQSRSEHVKMLNESWNNDPRWSGTKRGYGAEDVVKLQGSVVHKHSLAENGAKKLWKFVNEEPFVNALGALSGPIMVGARMWPFCLPPLASWSWLLPA